METVRDIFGGILCLGKEEAGYSGRREGKTGESEKKTERVGGVPGRVFH